MRILIADHDPDNLKIISLKLKAHHFEVIEAKDGEEALRLIRQEKPDVAILDVMMPKLSGFKVTRLIKFDSKLKKIPVILLTARAMETDKTLGGEMGADLYVTKPYDLDHLLQEVQRLIEKKE